MKNKLASLFAIAVLLASCTQQEVQNKPPNIIIIFADDLGYGDLGCYGNPTISTPNLDRMASEGMKFTQFYVGASVCTPSRAALLTGRLPVRNGLSSNRIRVLFPFSYQGIPDEEITLPEALKTAGYTTAIFGKWHLGHYEQYLPLAHGFDTFFGIPYSNDMVPTPDAQWAPPRKYPPLPLYQDREVIETEIDQWTLTKRYTAKAIEFIKGNSNNPFFIYYPNNFPHVPLYASNDFLGKSTRGIYGDVIEELDWSVGEILNTLKSEGLAENTFVFFTSDNGPWLTKYEQGGSSGLLRDGKGSTWEGGMREPAIAWWPGKIEAGLTTQALATTMDVFATALSLAGVEQPNDRTMDGLSMEPILFEQKAIRDEVYYYKGTELYAVRKGSWKIHFKTFTEYMGQQPVAHDPPLLYNLDLDPSEKINLNEERPEIVASLVEVAQQHIDGVEPVPSYLDDIDESYFED